MSDDVTDTPPAPTPPQNPPPPAEARGWTKITLHDERTLPAIGGDLMLWGVVDLDDPSRWDYIDIGIRDGLDVIDGDQRDTSIWNYTHWCRLAPPPTAKTDVPTPPASGGQPAGTGTTEDAARRAFKAVLHRLQVCLQPPGSPPPLPPQQFAEWIIRSAAERIIAAEQRAKGLESAIQAARSELGQIPDAWEKGCIYPQLENSCIEDTLKILDAALAKGETPEPAKQAPGKVE